MIKELKHLPILPISQPTLFLGHGSPMNIVESNDFTAALQKLPAVLPYAPKAIIVISAHWITEGTLVTSSEQLETIYDFFGFPEELYKVEYPAHGDPTLANALSFGKDAERGLDHGAWSVLRHMFPQANVPVIQISINRYKTLAEHLSLAAELVDLRRRGVLIIASGNLVHNLRKMNWKNMNASPLQWAVEFDELVKENLLQDKVDWFLNPPEDLFNLAHPTIDHYLPFLYTLGTKLPTDSLSFPIELFQNSTISMRAVLYK